MSPSTLCEKTKGELRASEGHKETISKKSWHPMPTSGTSDLFLSRTHAIVTGTGGNQWAQGKVDCGCIYSVSQHLCMPGL